VASACLIVSVAGLSDSNQSHAEFQEMFLKFLAQYNMLPTIRMRAHNTVIDNTVLVIGDTE